LLAAGAKPNLEDEIGRTALSYAAERGHVGTVKALLAAKAGATYVSPFIGRLDDVSTDGLTLIEDIRQIYDNYGYDTQILAASVRHPMHIIECAKIGADVATCPLSAITALLKHPLTDSGLAQFSCQTTYRSPAELQARAGRGAGPGGECRLFPPCRVEPIIHQP